ncbi:hypothetical protein [Alteromonas genovensis]|nr:hypothetical protein [Alteromonas genovensis]
MRRQGYIVRFDVNNSEAPFLNGIYQHSAAQINEQRIALTGS